MKEKMIMQEDEYYVVLDKNIKIDDDKKKKIDAINPLFSKTKIPFSDKYIDIYILSDKKECGNFIKKLDKDIQKLFKIEKLRVSLKYTAFLDILGFSQYIEKHITNDYEAEDFYNTLHEIIEHLKFMKEEKYNIKNAPYLNDMKINHSWVSDTFVITIEYTKDVEKKGSIIKGLMLFKLSAMISSVNHFIANKYGLLLRGAISSKYSCLTDTLILGEGIAESANLEKDIAIYPRVIFEQSIISDEIYEIISRQYNNNDLNYISKDCDGYYFVNYLAMLQHIPPMIGKTRKVSDDKLKEVMIQHKINTLKRYQEIVANGLKSKNEKIRSKYIWFNEYLGKVLLVEKFQNNIINNVGDR